jgi:TetR/AcrR family transcriptional regulator, regulator of cefoperazone and chloramphenicol sensitivity
MSSPADLTARARIRDAAIALFADRGVDGATIRDIAQAAGVSSGLLRHHFGSKEGLRDACDEFAMAQLTGLGMQFTELGLLPRLAPEVFLLQRFLIRSTMDGSPAGAAMFDRMLDYGEQWLAKTDLKTADPRAFVAVLSAMKMAMSTMHEQLCRAIGADPADPASRVRILTVSLDLFSQPLITPEQAAQARQVLERMADPTTEE